MWAWKWCNFSPVIFELPLHTVAGFIRECKASLLFNFRWLLRIIFETPQSLLNHSVSRVQIEREIFEGQLCGFVWLGGFWVVEEEPYMPAAWAVLWAATLCYLGGQWVWCRNSLPGLCLEVLPLNNSKLCFHSWHLRCFAEDESSSTFWL